MFNLWRVKVSMSNARIKRKFQTSINILPPNTKIAEVIHVKKNYCRYEVA